MFDEPVVRVKATRPSISSGQPILRVLRSRDPRFPLLAILGGRERQIALITPDRRAVPQQDPGAFSAILLADCTERPQEPEEILALLDEHCREEPL